MEGKKILLIITGGIAAYKVLDLIRRLREQKAEVRCVLTDAATHFVTPLSVAALSEHPVYQDLFSLTDETQMGHIQLSRTADLVVVAPATANILAKMAAGIADDLASTLLLATNTPVLAAPAMNVVMWEKPATQCNVATLAGRGIQFVGPAEGDLACGETGPGRMVEPGRILHTIQRFFSQKRPLSGRRVLVTSGPTHEPIDPVRYIGNRSSGKQGHAIAAALAELGAETLLVTGPTELADPPGVDVQRVETARDMLAAVEAALPVDAAVFAAAVADWRVNSDFQHKIKKTGGGPPELVLVENPDILATVAASSKRPDLVVGFAAETEDVEAHAAAKRERKGCDWVVANDVSVGSGTFGGDQNTVFFVTADGVEPWPAMAKIEVAERLAALVAQRLSGDHHTR